MNITENVLCQNAESKRLCNTQFQNGMSLSNPSFKDQRKWVNPRKLCLLDIAGLTEAHKILPLRRGSGCKVPPQWRSYLQLITFGKGKISFLQWSIAMGSVSHTPGQAPCSRSGWPNKMDSVICVCGPFVLIFHLNSFFLFCFVLIWFLFFYCCFGGKKWS